MVSCSAEVHYHSFHAQVIIIIGGNKMVAGSSIGYFRQSKGEDSGIAGKDQKGGKRKETCSLLVYKA